MKDAIFKKVELTGTSSESIESAINNAVSKAGESIRNIRWFEVTELRGAIENNKVSQWQASIKIGFRVGD